MTDQTSMPESQRQDRAIVSKHIVALTDTALVLLMTNESHPFSDEIHIEQLEVSTRIGVLEEERAAPQRLTISISFWHISKRAIWTIIFTTPWTMQL
jgi:hypothetical protein